MCDINRPQTTRNPSNHLLVHNKDCVIMSQSLTKGGCSVADIMHPPLPHPKAVPGDLTLEGINCGEAEYPFPEPSAGALCQLLITVRALGFLIGVLLTKKRVKRHHTTR